MRGPITLLVLFAAAALEAGGDAAVRAGLHGASWRVPWLLGGAALLFAYGCVVNTPHWTFGRLLGVYVAMFFLLAQGIAWLGFREAPTPRILVGGALIVAGGLIVAGK